MFQLRSLLPNRPHAQIAGSLNRPFLRSDFHMTGYQVALFVHFLALIAAVVAATLVHFADGRRTRARTVREMLEWHNLLQASAKVFPVSLVLLVGSGTYMIVAGALRAWSSGFVVAGLTGSVILLVTGATLAAKGRAITTRLQQLVDQGRGGDAPDLPPDRALSLLQRVPDGIVLGVIFDMVAKPGVGVALSALVVGVAASVAIGVLTSGETVGEPAVESEPSAS